MANIMSFSLFSLSFSIIVLAEKYRMLSLNTPRNTFLAPKRKTSESSVITPSTKFYCSKKAHCASAYEGALIKGIPNISSNL